MFTTYLGPAAAILCLIFAILLIKMLRDNRRWRQSDIVQVEAEVSDRDIPRHSADPQALHTYTHRLSFLDEEGRAQSIVEHDTPEKREIGSRVMLYYPRGEPTHASFSPQGNSGCVIGGVSVLLAVSGVLAMVMYG
jgi:hypothetical protein